MNVPVQDSTLKQAILAALSVQSGINLAILFGSLVTGEGRLESDLDLAVDAGHRLTASEKIELISEQHLASYANNANPPYS